MHALAPSVQNGLRRHALALKAEQSRGHLPMRVWAGDPAGEVTSGTAVCFDTDGHTVDDADRGEITLALANSVCEKVSAPLCWVTRSGTPDLCPNDLAWLAAAHRSWRELDLSPSFAVVTRDGWVHHPSETERRWYRLRDYR